MFQFGGSQQAVSTGGVDQASKIIEEFFRKNKIDPNAQRVKTDPSEICWTITRGSSVNYIFLTKIGDIDTVRVASPILFLPQENLLPLYRRCLELNFMVLDCAFAINKDMIVVVSERPILGLDATEFENMMRQVSYIADTYDNQLADEFHARLYTQGR